MKNKWWGYLHTNGSIQAKRFFDHRDLQEAAESPFVCAYHGPFDAEDRTKALKILEEHFTPVR
jgi:hypothetical protein